MFHKENIKIRNMEAVFKEETEEFATSSNHGLIKIKCEFDKEATTYNTLDYQSSNIKYEDEKTKFQYGVLENQLKEENLDEPQFFDCVFSENAQKIASTINDMFYKKAVNIEDDEIKSETTEKYDEINIPLDSSNIKCEFEEEETKIQYGVFENQLPEEHFDKSTMDIPELPISVKKIDQHNTQTKEIVYKCETCNKCFTTKGNLNMHIKIHTGEKPYKCETCNKCFTTKGNLNMHMNNHTGEKPYKCETCDKCFVQKGALNKHKRIHIGVKPYKCETCGKCFTEKGNLNVHKKTHTGEKPYMCETCGKCFTLKEHLNRHNIFVRYGKKETDLRWKICHPQIVFVDKEVS